MNRYINVAAATIAGLWFGLQGPVTAALVTNTYSFIATDFIDVGFNPPQDPVSGIITITFDPAAVFIAADPVDSISMTVAGHIYTAGEVGIELLGNVLTIGGFASGVSAITGSTDDFALAGRIDTATGAFLPGSVVFDYTVSFVPTFDWLSLNVTIRNIPEPSTLALIGVALVSVTFSRRRMAREWRMVHRPS